MVEIPDKAWRDMKLDLRDAQEHAWKGHTGAVYEHLRVINNTVQEIERGGDNDD